jgi:hypothetical protein
VLADAHMPLVITEGELKAACVYKHGLFCRLGGVWSWKSKKEDVYLLPVLQDIASRHTEQTKDGERKLPRTVNVAFDSDAVSNPNVHAAENALAHELTQLGADVYICRIPALAARAVKSKMVDTSTTRRTPRTRIDSPDGNRVDCNGDIV